MGVRAVASTSLVFLLACGTATPTATPDPELPKDLGARLAPVPAGTAPTLATLCARPHDNPVADGLCSGPAVQSLSELLVRVGLTDADHRVAVLTGNSSSLVARRTTPLNPRLIVFPRDRDPAPKLVALSFLRGEQLVELVAHDGARKTLTFYLLRFSQACNQAPQGCGPEDLWTERIEQGWTAVELSDDRDLAGTAADCLVCHEPLGPGRGRMLHMQERAEPWVHWFPAPNMVQLNFPSDPPTLRETEKTVQPLFEAAHAGESHYGGLPLTEIFDRRRSSAVSLAALVQRYNELDEAGRLIATERFEVSGNALPDSEFSGLNTGPLERPNAEWKAYEAAARSGQRFFLPFYAPDPSDSAKRARATEDYLALKAGRAVTELDLSNIFSAEAEAALGFLSGDEDGPGLIARYCVRCHNGTLDQTLPRARFDATRWSEMSAAERAIAAERVLRSRDDPGVMPPVFVGSLSPASKARLVESLK